MNIYVGNLAPDTKEEELRQAFAEYGQVVSAKIIKDRYTFESRGFGFVEIPNKAQATEAMEKLNGAELCGNILRVNEARPRREQSRGGGGDRRW
jgi:RNA recognition motif-containing protein